ncbi:MAG: Fic family protein [Propionibacteriaceae bacterium]|jgi:Fic family protein|nr:Fic family protein [Propionibacteriaceae bacterium]
METIFGPPRLDGHDAAVMAEVNGMRDELSHLLRVPRRWQGTLRRSAQAKAIQGSNSIEGYVVSDSDAAAAVDGEEALDADRQTWAEILGYRRVMTYVLNVATTPGFTLDESAIKAMHFMLLDHDLAKQPGVFRAGPVYVTGARGTTYTAPDAERVPTLMAALVEQVRQSTRPPLVKAALAHLNLVAIHPFRDGNGRMARVLQTLVLAQDKLLEPAFSSIEEWLGANTADYYAALIATQAGSWRPDNDTSSWVRFNLRAHHMQAQTTRRRFHEGSQRWIALDGVLAEHGLPDRVEETLFNALLGWRVSRPPYVEATRTDARTATRDFARLVDLGLLVPHGETRGRHYTLGPRLERVNQAIEAARQPLSDPYPDLLQAVHADAAKVKPDTTVFM